MTGVQTCALPILNCWSWSVIADRHRRSLTGCILHRHRRSLRALSSSSPIGINVGIDVEVRSECSSQSWASTLRSWLWALTLRWGEIFNSSHLTNSYKVRALSSGLSNVPNAKYLAHLTHQTPKTLFIRCSKCHNFCNIWIVSLHICHYTDGNGITD